MTVNIQIKQEKDTDGVDRAFFYIAEKRVETGLSTREQIEDFLLKIVQNGKVMTPLEAFELFNTTKNFTIPQKKADLDFQKIKRSFELETARLKFFTTIALYVTKAA